MSATNMQWTINQAMQYITPIINTQLESVSHGLRKIINLFGSPGLGKTTVILKAAKELWDAEVLIVKIPTLTMDDLSGLPDHIKIVFKNNPIKAVEWAVADIVRQIYIAYDNHPKNRLVVVLDDSHFCPEESHPYLMALLDYELKGFKIPNNVAFVVISNDSNIAGAIQFPSPIMSRMIHFDVTTIAPDWLDVMKGKLHPTVSAFLSIEHNHGMLITDETKSHAYACPRSWHNLSDTLKIYEENNITITDISTHIKIAYGHIGTVSSKFSEFAILFTKYNMKEIFDTGEYSFPDEDVEKFPFILSAANYFSSDTRMYAQRAKLMGKMLCELFDTNKIFMTVTFAFVRSNESARGFTAITELLKHIDNDKQDAILAIMTE